MPAFKVPASKKSIDQNRFEVEATNGKTFQLPSLKYIDPNLMVQVEAMPQMAGTKHMFESIAPGLFETFEDGEQVGALMEAWQEFSGVTLGESQASAG